MREALKAEYEHNRAQQELIIRAAERAHDFSNELRLKAMEVSTRDATEAMKVTLAINGATGIAVLTFLAAPIKEKDIFSRLLSAAIGSFGAFAVGVLCAMVTAGSAYICNSYYAAAYRHESHIYEHPFVKGTDNSTRYLKAARRWNWTAVIAASTSAVAWIVGVAIAAWGLAKLG
ncbi:MAG: hypothetical protein ACM3JG_00385 [Thiohalocapsa sp.]